MFRRPRRTNLYLICSDPKSHTVWRDVVANNCDTVLLALPKAASAGGDIGPSTLETELLGATLTSNIQMVLYRETSELPTDQTAAWLVDRKVSMHHHLALDQSADFERIARFVRGEALGLVLCGGGSFGTAHLGAIKALAERGYTFDFVGGTSIGSAMAAALVIGLDPDKVMDLCDDIFI